MSAVSQVHAVGPLAFRLDAGTGMVRDLRFHGCEILRAIYPAVRDPRWGTPQPQVASVQSDSSRAGLTLNLTARVAHAEIDCEWQATIRALPDGILEYRWRAQALKRFATNRTGLCVLHPAGISGAPCVIEHVDGQTLASWFPAAISPHQPFRNVRGITHVAPGGAEVRVRMEGEVFETEDQRNWTDASFKTYCRPLDWPRPYELPAGAVVEQAVRVSVQGVPSADAIPAGAPASDARSHPLRIGYTLPEPIPPVLRERMRALKPAHLRVETDDHTLDATLAWARGESDACGCELHVALRGASHPPPRDRFPAHCLVALFDSAGNTARPEVIAAWRDAGFTRLAAGTLHHFTELNRNRPPAHGAHSHTTFGINAQVHAFDDASLNETLAMHAVVARHAQILGAGRPVCVAPLMLGPTATTDDYRLQTTFGAEWARQSLAQLQGAGCVESVTLFRTHGAGGVLREEGPSPLETFLRGLATHA